MLQVSSKSNDSKLYSSFELLKRTLVISEFEENNKLSDLCKFEIKITNYFLSKPKLYPLDTGRLLNVLCKFKLRPVSRGYTSLLLYHLPFTLLNSTYFNENSFCSIIRNTVILNPFQPNLPFLQPLEISENQRFSAVFRGYTDGTLG